MATGASEKVIQLDARSRGASQRYSRVPVTAPLARLRNGRKLRGESLQVLIALGRHTNRAADRCYPGNARLAAESGIEPRNLHRNLRDLVEADLLRINDDGSYTLLFGGDLAGEAADLTGEEAADLTGEAADLTGEAADLTGEAADLTGDTRATRTTHRTAQVEHIPLGVPSGGRVYSPVDVMFEEFWAAFPHRPADPKRVARAVFGEIVNSGGVEPALLVERAQEHAANVEGLQPRYWMMAHKWLREECWSDQTVHPIRSQGIAAAAARVVLDGGPLRRKSAIEKLYAGFAAAAGFGQPGDEWAAKSTPDVSDAKWREMLTEFATTNRLSSTWLAMFPGRGLPPQNSATRVPMHLREEFGFV